MSLCTVARAGLLLRVELLGKRVTLAGIVTKQKPSAAVGAEQLDAYAREVGAIITAIGD